MAQTIKIKRGGIGAITLSNPSTDQGELILGTGSLNNGLTGSLFIAEADDKLRLPYTRIDSVVSGTGLASDIGSNTAFTGLLIHSASDNKLYRYSGTAFEELPIAAGSFTGILGVDSGGTGVDTLTDGAVLIGNGTSAVESVTMTNGQFLIGNSSDNPSAVNASTIAGAGLTATTGPGTATLNVDSGSFPINELDNSTDLSVANGGTGASTLTNYGVLVGSGTDPITALTPGTAGQLLIGANSADPAFQTVSGVITIDASGVTDFSVGGASAISGSFTSVSASIAADITTNAGGIATNASDISTLQGQSGTTTYALTDGDGIQTFSFNGSVNNVEVAVEPDQTTITSIKNNSLVIGSATGDDIIDFSVAGGVQIKTNNQARITVVDSGVTIAGNLEVTGTTTTIDSTTVQIGDNIIELNGTGATNGGLLIKDVTAPNAVSGSLLWDTTNDYWKGGALGSEQRIPLQDANMVANSFVIATGAGTIDDVETTTAGDILQWNGSSMVASNLIDGGTF